MKKAPFKILLLFMLVIVISTYPPQVSSSKIVKDTIDTIIIKDTTIDQLKEENYKLSSDVREAVSETPKKVRVIKYRYKSPERITVYIKHRGGTISEEEAVLTDGLYIITEKIKHRKSRIKKLLNIKD